MPLRSPWPAINIAREFEPPGKGPDMDLERRVAYGLLNLPSASSSQDLVDLTELRVTPTDDGWLVMLKGTRRGKKLVCFFHDSSWAYVLRQAVTMLDSGHAVWRVEKPPPWKR